MDSIAFQIWWCLCHFCTVQQSTGVWATAVRKVLVSLTNSPMSIPFSHIFTYFSHIFNFLKGNYVSLHSCTDTTGRGRCQAVVLHISACSKVSLSVFKKAESCPLASESFCVYYVNKFQIVVYRLAWISNVSPFVRPQKFCFYLICVLPVCCSHLLMQMNGILSYCASMHEFRNTSY